MINPDRDYSPWIQKVLHKHFIATQIKFESHYEGRIRYPRIHVKLSTLAYDNKMEMYGLGDLIKAWAK